MLSLLLQTSVQDALQKNEKSFTELIQSMKDIHIKVTKLIEGQVEAVEKQVKEFIEALQQEISNLKDVDAKLHHLELLSRSNDDVRFLEVQ